MKFVSFPSIEGFFNVVKFTKSYPHYANDVYTYNGKIKLHGTNAGIRIKNGEVVAQSRSQLIYPTSDNAGFAKWVDTTKDYWKNVRGTDSVDLTVFGEWCGPGIMKGTAVNQISRKIFAIFAINLLLDDEEYMFITDPEKIRNYISFSHPDVYVLPWHGESFQVDFRNEANLRQTAEMLNKRVEEIEHCDPWVKENFNIEGVAEGVVYYPDTIYRHVFSNFAFKAKGEKHRVVKSKEAVQIDPEVAENIDQFVNLFVTDSRMEQGLFAIGNSLEMKNIGPFLKWVSCDVFKESLAELEASGLTWDQVQKAVQNAARNWFISKNKSI